MPGPPRLIGSEIYRRSSYGGRHPLAIPRVSLMLDLVRTLKGSRWQIFTKIQLPGALPYIFSGMKVAAILAVAGAIVGEFLGSDRGLGYLMLQVQVTLDTAAMFMAVILITLIGMVLYAMVLALERLLVPRDARIS